MAHPLSGKVVVITGASKGIGAAMARALAPLGCTLVLTARSEDRLRALAREVGGGAVALPADVTDADSVRAMIDGAVERFGRVDTLLANAGIYIPGAFHESDLVACLGLMRVNVEGVMRCVHAVLPHMMAQHTGDILVTSSISGHMDIHWEPVYSASKHAVQTFVHTLRRQMIPHGVRVGSIAPGMVANELWGINDPVEIDRLVSEKTALRSEDVAEAAVFMLSRPPHITIRDLVMVPHSQDL